MKQTLIKDLELKIEQTRDSFEKVKLLNELALILEDSNLSYAIRVVDEAVNLAQSLDESNPEVSAVVAISLFTRGLLNLETTNYELTISSIYQALPFITQIKDDLLNGRAFEVLAKANFAMGNAPEGFEFTWQALSYYETLSNRRWQAGLYNLVGRQYMQMGQLDWAERYFQQAVDQMEGLPTNKTHADIHLNWCLLDTKKEDFEQAQQHVHEAIKIYRSFNAMDKLTKALVIHARVHETLKDYDEALKHLNQALQICEDHGLLYRKVRVLLAMGQIKFEIQDYDSAFSRLQEALAISEQLNMRHEGIRIHRSLARGYKQIGDIDKSLDHFESFFRYEKQIEKEQDVQRIRSLEIMHQVAQTPTSSRLLGQQSLSFRDQLNLMRTSQLTLSPSQITDPLTGLLNRKHFLTILENDHLNIEHYGKIVSLVMLDVDQFKKVNQENGNLIADQILVELSQMLRGEFRPRDQVWRISGEEFVILLPNIDCKHAQILAERLLQHVREHIFEIDQKTIQITISMGIACTSADDEKPMDMLLEHANHAWLIAKQNGGNQVVTWHSSK
ncbi:MAG: GGDEF domain-containing protein [Anaerolineaceae bacterium]|nr:GGDEF domain-containing protein [Anaerolineaceae bacterium]